MMTHLPAMTVLWSGIHILRRLTLIGGMLVDKAFYDTLQGRPAPALSLPGYLVLTAVAGLADITTGVLRSGVGADLGFRIYGWLQRNLLRRILDQPGARALPGTVGEALSTLDDDVDELESVGLLPLDLLHHLIFFGGGLAILLWVDVQVTLLVLLPMLALLFLARIGKGRLERVRAQSREAAARFTGGLGEVLASVQAVQVAGAEERAVAHLRRLGEARQEATLRDLLQVELWGAVFHIPWIAGMGLVLPAAAAKMRTGAFTVGDLALFVAYLDEIGELFFYGGNQLIRVRLARVAVERLLALLRGPAAQQSWVAQSLPVGQAKPDGAKPPRGTSGPAELDGAKSPRGTSGPRDHLVEGAPLVLRKPLPALPLVLKTPADRLETLQVDRLTLRHDEAGAGIAEVSFALRRGTLTAIVGRIGAGKTTLLRALLGLLPVDGGEVRWNGETVGDPATFFVPPRVAYAPQVPVLLSDTLRENILLGWPDDAGGVARALHTAVLEPDLATFPEGLDTMIGVRGKRLSGGQIQRTAAARMLVREPELLVIDDLSSALDVETEQVLWQRVFDGNVPRTCLVVSHRRAVLQRADQILVLENGHITARDTLAELLETSEEMRRLYAIGKVTDEHRHVR
jgi:ATP-binding cassette subfamily B protein